MNNITLSDIKFYFKFILNINIDKHICSPFRRDLNPTLSFKIKNDTIIWKDWGTGEGGDYKTFISKLLKCNYNEVDLLIKENKTFNYYPKEIIKKDIIVDPKNIIKDVITKPFNRNDYFYWKEYGISINTLYKFNIFSIESFIFKNEYLFTTKKGEVKYGYYFGKDYWKIYSPYRETYRFLYNGNSNIIQGYNNLPKFGDLLIITKSLKDVMLLHELNYFSIAPQGETVFLNKELIDILKIRFKEIIVLYDNDNAGLAYSEKFSKEFNLKNVIIPKEIETKDLSDTYRRYNLHFLQQLLNSIL